MKESIIDKKVLTVVFGFLFIGGVAAILGIFHAAKNTECPPGCVQEAHDGDTFVCGAYA